MDPFEEFEFKPITEGLGFHKKSENTKGESEKSPVKPLFNTQGALLDIVESDTTKLNSDLNKSTQLGSDLLKPNTSFNLKNNLSNLDFDTHKTNQSKNLNNQFEISKSNLNNQSEANKSKTTTNSFSSNELTKSKATGLNKALNLSANVSEILKSPLPKKGDLGTETKKENISSAAVDEILKSLKEKRNLDFVNASEKAKKSEALLAKEKYTETNVSVGAFILDTMLILAGGLISMIILLLVTKADLIKALTSEAADPVIYGATLSVFAMVALIYYVAMRVFIGFTPGEWAFDQRIGTEKEQQNPYFALKIVFRSCIVILSGFIILPIISLLMGKDLTGQMTGASLVGRNLN